MHFLLLGVILLYPSEEWKGEVVLMANVSCCDAAREVVSEEDLVEEREPKHEAK